VSPGYWNGTLLLFNGSKSSTDFGILQMGSSATYGSFDGFLRVMQAQVITVDPATGTMEYAALSGDTLRLGRHGVQVPAFVPLSLSYDSPYLRAEHAPAVSRQSAAAPFTVQLRFPGFANSSLHFSP
jgi:hypothetical protein